MTSTAACRPDYVASNPRGTVPTLIDGQVVLYETPAILEYLIETRPAAFYRWFKADEMTAGDAVEALADFKRPLRRPSGRLPASSASRMLLG